MLETKQTFRKITVEVPEDILSEDRVINGKKLTQTVRESSQTLANKLAYQRLRDLRGSYPDIELEYQ